MRFATLILILVSLVLPACVSVSLGQRQVKRAAGVSFSEPTKPFARDSRSDVDGAWKNPKNGNLISFLTDCQDESDPSLDSIVQGTLTGVSALKFEKTDSPTVQGREGRRTLASGKVDGVPTQVDLLVFKRDSCIYILSYVGVQSSFAENHAQFDRFISGFKAP